MSLQVPSSLKSLQAWTRRRPRRVRVRPRHATLGAPPTGPTDQTLVGLGSGTAGSAVTVAAVAGLRTAAPPAALRRAPQLGD